MKYDVEFDLDLKRNPYRGLYIAIEGIDGCGKTTQVNNLKKLFETQERSVVITSEPRKEESAIGKLIHSALEGRVKLPFSSFQDLYSAERVINHETVVIPALKEGKAILSHRCFWSAVAYGVFDKGETKYTVSNSNVIIVANGILSKYYQFIVPDYTFYLAVRAKTAMKRILKMGKRREIYEEKEKLLRIIAGYDYLLKNFAKEITMINGEEEEERVTEKIVACIK